VIPSANCGARNKLFGKPMIEEKNNWKKTIGKKQLRSVEGCISNE
jgi:hypothetical protein